MFVMSAVKYVEDRLVDLQDAGEKTWKSTTLNGKFLLRTGTHEGNWGGGGTFARKNTNFNNKDNKHIVDYIHELKKNVVTTKH